ncbi:hypothetical protein E8E13_000077 [Curvularia kusanoi]|uniref:Uncharacterized protein n=1 Tax=Curvularia kusanoi TaxID=90978 RepID=A0A9P4W1H1_CURKU|nr:hypothetical protein E8E13_000077 [Curvularia kusanoi]
MPSYLVTGSSCGLGLGFVTQLLQCEDNIVVATARDTAGASGLQELTKRISDGRLILIDLDVTKPESIAPAVEKTAKALPDGPDHLISNAGISGSGPIKTFDELDTNKLTEEIKFPVV